MANRGWNGGQLAMPVVKGALGESLVAAIATDAQPASLLRLNVVLPVPPLLW